LAWDRVLAAYGFKRDCVSTDQICLLIGDEESDRWIEVREDDTGYKALIEELPIRIPAFLLQASGGRRSPSRHSKRNGRSSIADTMHGIRNSCRVTGNAGLDCRGLAGWRDGAAMIARKPWP
jgi:hypothetical protein